MDNPPRMDNPLGSPSTRPPEAARPPMDYGIALKMEAIFHSTTMATFTLIVDNYMIARGDVKPSPEVADVLAAAVKLATLDAIARVTQRSAERKQPT